MKENIKIIDGKDAVLGRIAAYAAKESLKNEEVIILNCDYIKISGNKKDILNKFYTSKTRAGTIQSGPKISRLSYKLVKRTIRGMLPDHREGRGKEALGRIKCYAEIPLEFENKEKIKLESKKLKKFIYIRELVN